MDVMLYSLVLAFLIREFAMDTRTAGFLNSLTLLASAIGGLLFGWIADRVGRTRALMASIVLYSIASAACGFSHSIPQLATFRFLLGLGMGGEWTAGAALIAETWRPAHRGKALGLMQSAYAIGEAIAALVVAVVLPNFGWRAVFFVGVLPALLVFWIRRHVPEPPIWTTRTRTNRPGFFELLLKRRCVQGRNSRNGDECLRHVRLLGTIHVDSGLPFAPGFTRRARLEPGQDDDFLPGALSWQVAGLRAVRIFCGRLWPPQTLLYLFADRRRSRSALRQRQKRILAFCLALSWLFSGLDFSPGMPPSPARFSPVKFAPPPWDSATTSAEGFPPPHLSRSVHWPCTMGLVRLFSCRARRFLWRRCSPCCFRKLWAGP